MEKTKFALDELTDYNDVQPGESHEAKMAQMEFWLAKQIGTDLVKTYPNRQWIADVDIRNEVIVIGCPSLSNTLGYRLHIGRDTVADLLPRCRKAAGEILERYNVTRARVIDPAMFDDLPRDVRDNVISPDAATTVH